MEQDSTVNVMLNEKECIQFLVIKFGATILNAVIKQTEMDLNCCCIVIVNEYGCRCNRLDYVRESIRLRGWKLY